MKILLYGINFAPVLTGIGKYTGELAAWLAAPKAAGQLAQSGVGRGTWYALPRSHNGHAKNLSF
jgi:colanic acid biosynthesis glycosyl transferase WcaI